MTDQGDDRYGRGPGYPPQWWAPWARQAPPPGYPPPPPWYRGMAAPYPPPEQWPGYGQVPGGPQHPGAAPVPDGAADGELPGWAGERAKVPAEWRPHADELTRWGVERVMTLQAGLAATTVPESEVTRMTLALPGAATCLVWASVLQGGDPQVSGEVRILAGIGTVQVPLTPWVALTPDGIARVLGPSDARISPPVVPGASMPMAIPVKWLSLNVRLASPAPPGTDTTVTVGAIIGATGGYWW